MSPPLPVPAEVSKDAGAVRSRHVPGTGHSRGAPRPVDPYSRTRAFPGRSVSKKLAVSPASHIGSVWTPGFAGGAAAWTGTPELGASAGGELSLGAPQAASRPARSAPAVRSPGPM